MTEEYPSCLKCDSADTIRFGTDMRGGKRTQRYKCNDCGHVFLKDAEDKSEQGRST